MHKISVIWAFRLPVHSRNRTLCECSLMTIYAKVRRHDSAEETQHFLANRTTSLKFRLTLSVKIYACTSYVHHWPTVLFGTACRVSTGRGSVGCDPCCRQQISNLSVLIHAPFVGGSYFLKTLFTYYSWVIFQYRFTLNAIHG